MGLRDLQGFLAGLLEVQAILSFMQKLPSTLCLPCWGSTGVRLWVPWLLADFSHLGRITLGSGGGERSRRKLLCSHQFSNPGQPAMKLIDKWILHSPPMCSFQAVQGSEGGMAFPAPWFGGGLGA